MVVCIYNVISHGLLAKMDRVNSVEEAKLQYAKEFLNEDFMSLNEFEEKYPIYSAGMFAVALS